MSQFYCREDVIGSCKYRNEKIGVDELDLIRDYASVFGKVVEGLGESTSAYL
mgnify:CR=1 FL=1